MVAISFVNIFFYLFDYLIFDHPTIPVSFNMVETVDLPILNALAILALILWYANSGYFLFFSLLKHASSLLILSFTSGVIFSDIREITRKNKAYKNDKFSN